MELSFIVVTTQWNFYCLSFHHVRFLSLSLFRTFMSSGNVVVTLICSFAYFPSAFWVSLVFLNQENKLQNLWSFIFSTFSHYNSGRVVSIFMDSTNIWKIWHKLFPCPFVCTLKTICLIYCARYIFMQDLLFKGFSYIK